MKNKNFYTAIFLRFIKERGVYGLYMFNFDNAIVDPRWEWADSLMGDVGFLITENTTYSGFANAFDWARTNEGGSFWMENQKAYLNFLKKIKSFITQETDE